MLLARKYSSGIHVHAAEDKIDQEMTLPATAAGSSSASRRPGVLEFKRTILVHGLHLDRDERAILKGSPAWLAENMESNLNNRVGFFSGEGLSSRIMLGTDGMHSDMLQSARAAYFNGSIPERAGMADIYRRLRRVHDYCRRTASAATAENNLVVLDYPSPTPVNAENFLGHLFYGLGARHVDSVIARGQTDRGEPKGPDRRRGMRCWPMTRAGAEKLWRKLAETA